MRIVEPKEIKKNEKSTGKESKLMNYYNKSLGILKSSFSTGAGSNNNNTAANSSGITTNKKPQQP